MFIRYYAQTDDSSVGHVAFEYLKGLLRIGPVRLFSSPTAAMTGRWKACMPLLATAMTGSFVNVVCCSPDRWTWMQSAAMPNLDKDDKVISVDHTHARVELYTQGVRNVLIATCTPPSDDHQLTAERYEAIVVPTADLQARWQQILPLDRTIRAVPPIRPTVIPIPIISHIELSKVVALK